MAASSFIFSVNTQVSQLSLKWHCCCCYCYCVLINLTYLMLSPLFDVSITQLNLLFPLPVSFQEYCAAADVNSYCDVNKVLTRNTAHYFSNVIKCIQYAKNNRYKFIEVEKISSDPIMFVGCYEPTKGTNLRIDADGNCTSCWIKYHVSVDSSSCRTYIIQNFTLWHDGYSCYKNGSLKKYFPLHQPLLCSNPFTHQSIHYSSKTFNRYWMPWRQSEMCYVGYWDLHSCVLWHAYPPTVLWW